jgi:hypothetical protein
MLETMLQLNTKLFHLRANGRRRKNHIPELVGANGKVSTHKEKEEILYKFFKGSLGEAQGRTVRLNWDILNMPRAELQQLDEHFTEEELKVAVFGMPGEKAPGLTALQHVFSRPKPSAGCSTMEKVQLVLMKKSGLLSDDASPQAADLQRYRNCTPSL